MKSLKTVFLLGATIFLFSSCDELITKEIDVPITFTLYQEIEVEDESIPYGTIAFEYDGYFDILTHPDISNAIGTPDKIKKVTITEIEYEYQNFKGNVDAVIRGDFILPEEHPTNHAPFERMFAFKSVKVAEADLLNEKYILNGSFTKVNEYLSQSAVFDYAVSGVTTHNPVNFLMVFNVSATVTVEASIDFKGNFN